MTWLAFRHYRSELLAVLAILAAMAVLLVPTGLDKLSEFQSSGLEACVEAGESCAGIRDRFVNSYNSINSIVGWFNFAPAIVGMLMAAPIVADLEQRTHRLAWTQSISRSRWLKTKVIVGLSGVVAFSILLTALMTWWHAPLDRSITLVGRDFGSSYEFEGAMPFVYTLFAFAIAFASGVATRRTLAMVPVALVSFIVFRLGIQILLRQGLSSDVAFEAPADGLGMNESTRDMAAFWRTQAKEAAIYLAVSAGLIACAIPLALRRS